MITLTATATEHIRALRDTQPEHHGKPLRLAVNTGGCSGMEYDMAFDDRKPDDELIEQDGVAVVVDPVSLNFLKGSTVDYTDNLKGSGFQIQNPNVHSSCGCGRSFN